MLIGSIGKATFTMNMVLFLIILPYSYLTNTSHNKTRIVDEGWQNVLKNIFFDCGQNNGRNTMTRVYAISNHLKICDNEANEKNDVVSRIVQGKSNPGSNSNTELHARIQEDRTTDARNEVRNQYPHAESLSGMKQFRPYYNLY